MIKKIFFKIYQHKLAFISLIIITFFFLLSLTAPIISYISELNPEDQNIFNRYLFLGQSSEETFHLLGTDELGRDILIRLIYGARVSMGIALVVAFFSSIIGLTMGTLAGYYKGKIDSILMRITDSVLALPILPILIIFAAIDMNKIPFLKNIPVNQASIIKMIIILSLFSWTTVARLIRSQVLSLREKEFVLAAKIMGAKESSIILNHIIPNTMAALLVSSSLIIGEAILWEAALSFLGLGVQPPIPSWGNMLFNAQELIFEAPHLAILPGSLILIIVMSFNFLGDGLQNIYHPKLK